MIVASPEEAYGGIAELWCGAGPMGVTILSAAVSRVAPLIGLRWSTRNERRHMKIVVIGGGGRLGSKLATRFDERGHQTVAASPDTGVDTLTGEGLADALAGASVVVDVSNAPSLEDAAVLEFFDTSTRNLLAAEAAAGVGHHIALSVVGTGRPSESGYLRAKLAQEELIKESSIPYSIVRATWCFESMNSIAADANGNTVRTPPALIQPITADDVASALERISVGSPVNGIVEIAGPDQLRLREALVKLAAWRPGRADSAARSHS